MRPFTGTTPDTHGIVAEAAPTKTPTTFLSMV
jgi:hypothetical protein